LRVEDLLYCILDILIIKISKTGIVLSKQNQPCHIASVLIAFEMNNFFKSINNFSIPVENIIQLAVIKKTN